jgi:hypothetical protein
VAHPKFKDGQRSKYLKDLPREMRGAYKAALADPALASLDGELGLLEVRIGQLLRKLGDTPPPSWAHAMELVTALRAAPPDDPDALEGRLAALERVIQSGADAARSIDSTWRQLMGAIDQKTRTAAAEARRQSTLSLMIPLAEVALLLRSFMETAKLVVEANLGKEGGRPLLRQLTDKTLELLPSPTE